MKFKDQINNQHFEFDCTKYDKKNDFLLLFGKEVSVDIPFIINKYFLHGWQSWSLTAWIDPDHFPGVSYPGKLRVLQTDKQYSDMDHPNGSWLGSVSTSDGKILLLGSLKLGSHVDLLDNRLNGWCEDEAGEWVLLFGEEEEVFKNYTDMLSSRLGKSKFAKSPRIWCSWYSFYEEISEKTLLKVIDDLNSYPFDVIQIDDGWQQKIGDWEPNTKFPSGMNLLAKKIVSGGKKAGLWLAPLLVSPSSNTYKEHQDWLLRSENGEAIIAGFNWNEELFTLDATNPDVLIWLTNLMKKIREWGYDYIKLDFLYAGALEGIRYKNIGREEAFRLGLKTMREALGDAFLLTCGTPILPSIGLCDAMRIGPDVSGTWRPFIENRLLNNYAVPGAQNAIRTSLNRLWLKPLVLTDPDVVYFGSTGNSLTKNQKSLLQAIAIISDFKATSDLSHVYTPEEKKDLIDFLQEEPLVTRTNQYRYEINGNEYDFSSSVALQPKLNFVEKLLQSIIKKIADNKFFVKIFLKINSSINKRYIKKTFE